MRVVGELPHILYQSVWWAQFHTYYIKACGGCTLTHIISKRAQGLFTSVQKENPKKICSLLIEGCFAVYNHGRRVTSQAIPFI